MREVIRFIAIHVLFFLSVYVTLTGASSYLLVEVTHHDVGMSWALFWMIWVFVYWPVALGAAFVLWTVRPSPRRAAAVHVGYIAAAVIALTAVALSGSWWPMFGVKLVGLSFIFYCITGFRRGTGVANQR